MHDRQNYSENDNLAHMMSITILYKVGPGLVQTDTYISFAEKDIDIKLNPNRKIIIIKNKSTETNMCVHAQLVNHGVSSSLLQKLKSDLGEFYKFPSEERMKYKMRPGVVEGYRHSPIWLEDQKLDWGDRFYMTTNPIHSRKLHLLPELPPALRFSHHHHHLLSVLTGGSHTALTGNKK